MHALRLRLLLLLLLPLLTRAQLLIWIGALTSTSFLLHIDISPSVTLVTVSPDRTFTTNLIARTPNPGSAVTPADIYTPLHRFQFTSLIPNTLYYIALTVNNSLSVVASIRTYPNSTSPVIITFASCQFKPSWDDIFPYLLRQARLADSAQPPTPFLMLHMGDMIYSDIRTNNPALYEEALRPVLVRPAVADLFSKVNVAYMYDDHDYGPNNSGFSSPSREAALSNYRAFVPSYSLPSTDASYHAFTIASVRIILTDLRALAGMEEGSTLGARQREWLFQELESAKNYDVVVWMSSKPWIARGRTGADDWGGYAEERRQIANKIKELGIVNLVMVAGDAHMLAMDDGSHSDYSDGGGAGMPVFQAAPLGNFGSGKGGPYSGGCVGYVAVRNYQYGVLKVSKVREEEGPCVRFEGYVKGEEEASLEFERCGVLSIRGEGGQDTWCQLALFPGWVWGLITLGIVLFVVMVSGIGFWCWQRRKKKKTEAEGSKKRQCVRSG